MLRPAVFADFSVPPIPFFIPFPSTSFADPMRVVAVPFRVGVFLGVKMPSTTVRSTACATTVSDHVFGVFFSASPSKVSQTVVCLYVVKVPGFFALFGFSDPGAENEPMNVMSFLQEVDSRVSSGVEALLEFEAFSGMTVCGTCWPLEHPAVFSDSEKPVESWNVSCLVHNKNITRLG